MAITETWLNNSILDNSPLIQLHGFQPVFRRDRSANQQGGGVCLFVSSDVPAKRGEDLEHPEMELLWVEIKSSPLRSRKSQRSLLIIYWLLLSSTAYGGHILRKSGNCAW